MKILIPYDGSKNVENVLRDLTKAGFADSDRHEVLVVVSDVWLPETTDEFFRACAARRRMLERSGTCSYIPARRKFEEERLLCREASEQLVSIFPSWNIRVETLPGMSLASTEFLEKAETWAADLIMLNSSDDCAAAQTVRRGTGAARVSKEARCALRIAGGRSAMQTNALKTKDKKFKEKVYRPDFKGSRAAAVAAMAATIG